MLKTVFISALLVCAFHTCLSQMKDMDHGGMNMPMDIPMGHAFSLHLPMTRNGSGTSWLPDASPMYGVMLHSHQWMYMIHGNVFLNYTNQDFTSRGSRGDIKLSIPNWLMLMAQRRVGKNGLFHYNVMISLDPITEGGNGYPLLFQSGESWKGKPLVDRQHPHDLFSELSVSYSQALSPQSDIYIYVGYPGEPALGSPVFMHRPSALADPDAPLSHHWNDATHITFGVATIGYRYGKLKLEASSFTGREPNEDRYNFDKPLFDSWSGRLSYNPTANWAFQVSHGYVKSPEALHPEENIRRTTASAIASYPIGGDAFFNATALWGVNTSPDHKNENAVLAEISFRLRKAALYSRYEWVEKSTEELNLNPIVYAENGLFPVNTVTLGGSYDLLHIKPVNLALGAQLTWYSADAQLDNLYGKNPLGGEIFVRIYPSLMKM